MSKRRICFVAEYMYCGGTEKSLLSLLQYLDRTRYDITVLLMKKKGDLLSLLPVDIHVQEIPFPKDEAEDLLLGRNAALKNSLKKGHILQSVGKAFRGVHMTLATKSGTEKRLWYYQSIEDKIAMYPEEFDVVIDYMGYGLFNTLYAARKVKGKVKLSWVHFEPDTGMPDFYAFGSLLNEYDHIMCVSRNSMHQVQKMMPELSEKCHVFYNIVDRKSLYEQAGLEHIEKDTEGISILSVGRLDPQKGFDIGIGVIERLAKEGYPVKWQIIGEGWQRTELELRISQSKEAKMSVELLGQKLNPYPYFASCDIYFMPSRHEGYGIALAKARAFNKPIVATDFAGAREQLIDGVTGIITNCDEESIYQALKRLIDDRELQIKFSQALEEEEGTDQKQIQYLESLFDPETGDEKINADDN